MNRIIDRFIGSELFWPFVFGVAAFTSIFFATSQLLDLTKQVLNGLSVGSAVELVLLSLPSVVVYTLPMSALLASLIAFSRLSSDSEIVALYASGVSLYRAIVPVVIMGIMVTGMGFVLSEFAVPQANRLSEIVQARVLKEELSTDKPFSVIDTKTNSTLYVRGGLDAKTHTMRDVTIVRYNKDIPMAVFYAREAKWKGHSWKGENEWSLSDGSWYSLQPGDNRVSGTFEGWTTETVKLGQTPDSIARHQRKPENMSYTELKAHIADLQKGGVPPDQMLDFEVDLHNKIAIPFAGLVFALIGAPLAVRPSRAGKSVGIGLSILIIFSYWFTWHFSSALALQGSVSPLVGAFLADILGLILGVFLIIRTPK
jgi:lipopolysaccharide export system permease protein